MAADNSEVIRNRAAFVWSPVHLLRRDLCTCPAPATVVYQKPVGSKETRTESFALTANGSKVLDAVGRENYVLGRWGYSFFSRPDDGVAEEGS